MADEKTFISQLNSADTANDTDIMIIEGQETKKISFLALFNAIKKKISASLVFYDNSTSGIEAEDVQGAIDEVSEKTVKNSSDISVLNTKLEGIGTFYSGNGSNTSVPSGTSTPVASVKLPKGVYVLTGFVRFNANKNGYRYANFNTTSGASSQQVNDTHPNANYVTQLNLSMCVSVDAETTMYLNAYQNSGSDLTCPSGGTFIRVVKVA